MKTLMKDSRNVFSIVHHDHRSEVNPKYWNGANIKSGMLENFSSLSFPKAYAKKSGELFTTEREKGFK